LVEDPLHFEWGPLSFDDTESYLCFSLASYVQIENPNVLKRIINNNLEESKLSFIV